MRYTCTVCYNSLQHLCCKFINYYFQRLFQSFFLQKCQTFTSCSFSKVRICCFYDLLSYLWVSGCSETRSSLKTSWAVFFTVFWHCIEKQFIKKIIILINNGSNPCPGTLRCQHSSFYQTFDTKTIACGVFLVDSTNLSVPGTNSFVVLSPHFTLQLYRKASSAASCIVLLYVNKAVKQKRGTTIND